MADIASLINQVRAEAKREEFPIDSPVYRAAKLEPTQPVLYGGNLKSQLCFFGRDLGRDEVHGRQPLYGAAGTLVRQGFYYAMHGKKIHDKEQLATVCQRVLLTNTVPYKPPGNKAYSVAVKKRFRPFIEKLLVLHWQGQQIITLGTEAFKWFDPYGRRGEINGFFRQADRFDTSLQVTLRATDDQGIEHQKTVALSPLPHPSPLNQRYYAKFPQMLQNRLGSIAF
ncbi:Uracil-DNA glycosylase superfamily [[Leptolyngbya] sp. PCC 7376]|uniref:uracil-DNA glycosylase family protein n=1 Tax=[Leptolyngbya] sp. PCC 7376 TaxID=111781 RepID=UPI00029F187E|nr:uracil-DNA glycosylase family protein [[Leptolyngbya] sp. PCC 7376]AFY38022.1 Uracil-DNA glycosylase superfamily [[Leptolyngbya] sp. PCC 7376]